MVIMKRVVGITCILALLFSLTACTSEEEKMAAFTGTWTLSSVNNNSGDTPQDLMDNLQKSGLSYQLLLNTDGSGLLDLAGTQSSLNWTFENESEITITSEDNTLVATLQDGVLSINEGEITLAFSKADVSAQS